MAQQQQRFPQAPIFGLAGSTNDAPSNKFINIDEIFADCFMDTDQDLMGLSGTDAQQNGAGAGSSSSNSVGSGSTLPGQPPQQQHQQPNAPMRNMYDPVMQAQMMHAQQGPGRGMPMMHYSGMQLPPQHVSPPPPHQHQQQQQQLPPLHIPQQDPSGGGASGPNSSSRTSKAAKRVASSAAAASAAAMAAAAAGQNSGTDDDTKAERKKRPRTTGRNMSEQQKLERRERNREHAKRSRVRKKFLLESLQKSVSALQDENDKLRSAIRENCDDAKDLLAKSEAGGLLTTNPGDATRVLDDPDYSLVKALQTAQQNFVITDPTLPDNPIVFASQGFLDLTGYALDQVLGRNCRFLQGPDTDPKAVEKIRKAIENGCDTSVCLLNYRVDGGTFWNQFFIAALRDGEGKIINYVGVQCKVSEEFVLAVQKQEDGEDVEEEDDDDDYEL